MPAAKKAASKLDELLATAQKKYNIKAGPMDGQIVADTKAVTTGNIAIDTAIGVGGIPLGRTIELFGPPACGKTTTALQVAAELQKVIQAGGDPARGIGPDDLIMYLDYEQSMDRRYAKALGLDTADSQFIFAQPDLLEEGADFTIEAIDSGLVRLVIIDSVAAMVPSSVMDADVGKRLPAEQSRLMSVFIKKLNARLRENNASVIFINHEMELMEMGGAKRPGMPTPKTTPGGKALKYFASVRIQYTPLRSYKTKVIDPITRQEEEVPTSRDVKVTVVKNKVADPFRSAVAKVRYGRGFDNFATALIALAAHKKIIAGPSGYAYFHNLAADGLVPEWMDHEQKGTQRAYIRGEANVYKAADLHPEWRVGMIDLARTLIEQAATEDAMAVEVDDDEIADDDEIEAPTSQNLKLA